MEQNKGIKSKVADALIDLEELCRLPSIYATTVSRKKDKIAFYWDKTGRMELYVMDLKTRQTKQITHGELPRSIRAGLCWSTDDRLIVFAKDKDGDEQHNLFTIEIETGEVNQITHTTGCQNYPCEFSPDGQWLTILSNREGDLKLFKMRLDGSDVKKLADVAIFPLCEVGLWQPPHGKFIAFVANETEDPHNVDVYVVDSEGENCRRIIQMRVGSWDSLYGWSKDGRYLAIGSDYTGVNKVGMYDFESGQIQWLSDGRFEEKDGEFFNEDQSLLCVRNSYSTYTPLIYNIGTNTSQELDFGGFTMPVGTCLDDKKIVLAHTSPTRRSERVLYNLESGDQEILLNAEYGTINPRIFVSCKYLEYPSCDQLRIPALLYGPRHIPKGKKIPAIICVHGGPTGQWFRNFDAEVQFLVNRGYAVLLPNIRGSTGYGSKFRDMNRFDWGGGDLEDIVAGAEFLKKLSYVDPARLAVYGVSYGGYMTYMAMVKKPELWKCGIAWVGITHLKTLYEESMEHLKWYFRLQMGDPEKNAELWEERSALNFAQNLRGKLLIIHGVNDPRCPITQARLFRDRLLELGRVEGRDFEYTELTEEGHGSTDIDQKIRSFKILEDFLRRSL